MNICRRTTLFVSVIAAMLLWGCVTVKELIDKPKVEFRGLDLQGISLFEATPIFKFRLTNTNPMGLTVENIAYDLKINDKKFVKGVSAQKIRISADSSGDLELPITFNYLDVFETLAEFKNTDKVRYDLSGSVDIGPFSIPYRTRGEFDIPPLPDVTLKDIRVENISFGAASLVLDLELKNSNKFAVQPRALDYVMKLGDKELIRGVATHVPSLEQNGRARMEIPVEVSFFKLGRSLYQLLGKSAAEYQVFGQIIFDVPGRGQRRFPFKEGGKVRLRR